MRIHPDNPTSLAGRKLFAVATKIIDEAPPQFAETMPVTDWRRVQIAAVNTANAISLQPRLLRHHVRIEVVVDTASENMLGHAAGYLLIDSDVGEIVGDTAQIDIEIFRLCRPSFAEHSQELEWRLDAVPAVQPVFV